MTTSLDKIRYPSIGWMLAGVLAKITQASVEARWGSDEVSGRTWVGDVVSSKDPSTHPSGSTHRHWAQLTSMFH